MDKKEKRKMKKLIDDAAARYLKSRDKAELEAIQKIVDDAGDIYVMRINQADGIPYHVTFTPHTLAPLNLDNLPETAKELNIAKAL